MTTIKASAVRGASWTIAAGAVTRGLGLVASVMITHYVAPAALGEVAAASIFVLTAQSLTTLGMGQYLIATKEPGRANTFHITVLNFAGVALAVLVGLVIRVPLSDFLKVAGSARYLPWYLLGFVIDRIGFIPERLLVRQLEFRRLAGARAAGDLAYTVFSIGLAIAGMGAFAIVAASLIRSILKMLAMISGVSPADWLTPAPLEKEVYKGIFHYGLPVAGQAILLGMTSRWDNLLFSYLFGAAPMARYNVAYNLADVPADQIGEQIAEVLGAPVVRRNAAGGPEPRGGRGGRAHRPHHLSALHRPRSGRADAREDDPVPRVARGGGDAHDSGGSLGGAAPRVASERVPPHDERVAHRARDRDHQARPPLHVSCPRSRAWGQLWACVASVGLAFGGALAVAWGVIAHRIGGHIWSFVAECLPALAACAVMVVAVLATRWAFARTGITVRGVGLALEILAGAVGYLGALPIVARQTSKKLLTLVKQARHPKPASPGGPGSPSTPASSAPSA